MYFITGNAGKLAEMRDFFPDLLQLDIDLPEIQSIDAREIITAKLEAARSQCEGERIVEDTGLHFDCLGGLPGPLIKWFLKSMELDKLAEVADTLGEARARAVTWIGYSNGGEPSFFEGCVNGVIVPPRGDGFGWDPIFQPDGFDRTFGEMNREEKRGVSMRGIAAAKLKEFLQI